MLNEIFTALEFMIFRAVALCVVQGNVSNDWKLSFYVQLNQIQLLNHPKILELQRLCIYNLPNLLTGLQDLLLI